MVLDEADQMLDQGFAPRRRAHPLRHAAHPPDGPLLGYDARPGCTTCRRSTCASPSARRRSTTSAAEPDIEHSVVEVWGGDKFPVLAGAAQPADRGRDPGLRPHAPRRQNLARRLGRIGYEVEALQGDLGQTGARPHRRPLPRRPAPDPARDQRRRPRPRHAQHRPRDQLRPAGERRALRPPRRPHRPHGPERRGDHADHRRPTCRRCRRSSATWAASCRAYPSQLKTSPRSSCRRRLSSRARRPAPVRRLSQSQPAPRLSTRPSAAAAAASPSRLTPALGSCRPCRLPRSSLARRTTLTLALSQRGLGKCLAGRRLLQRS